MLGVVLLIVVVGFVYLLKFFELGGMVVEGVYIELNFFLVELCFEV